MIYIFFDKMSASIEDKSTEGSNVKVNEKLAEELHKPIIRKVESRKVHSSFKDNTWVLI